MGIGFTGGLDQSDILSDGTPFDGANIDAPISSAGGGVDWSSLTFKAGYADTSSGTIVSVSGTAGYLITVESSINSVDDDIVINIDGSHLVSLTVNNTTASIIGGPVYFSNSFTIETTSGGSNDAVVVWGEV